MKIKCPDCSCICEVDSKNIGQQMLCSGCEKVFEAVNENLLPCPDCFEMISKRAKVCPHCGAIFENISKASDSDNSDPEAYEDKLFVVNPSVKNHFGLLCLGLITAPLVIGLFILAYIYIKILFTRYEVTSKRIIICHGFISKTQSEIWIKDIRGATLSQSVWQRILRIGNISIGTAATADTEISMPGIAHPQKVVDKINSLRVK